MFIKVAGFQIIYDNILAFCTTFFNPRIKFHLLDFSC